MHFDALHFSGDISGGESDDLEEGFVSWALKGD